MKLRTDQREVLRPQVVPPKVAALPVSVRSIDVIDPIDNPQPSDYMKLPTLRDVGRIVTKIGTVVPNPISTAVNVVNKTAEIARPQPPKSPGLNLPNPPPVNLSPTPATPRLVDPNAKPKGWFLTTYENTFNNGITGKQIVWGIAGIATVLILMKTNVGRKVKRMFGGR